MLPPASGSLPPRMFPRGIPSAALPDAVTSRLRPAAPAPARFQARYHSHPPATSTPHGQAGGGSRPPVPLRFTAARLAVHPPPKKLRAPACGIMFVPHIMPPAPQESRSGAARKRFGSVHRVIGPLRLARPPPGATASSVVLVTPGASALLSSLVQLGRSCGND